MQLWKAFAGPWQKDNTPLIYHPIDAATRSDRPADGIRLEAGRHYFRLRIADMFLQRKVQWLSRVYPALHSRVRFEFGSRTVEIPSVSDASRVGMQRTDRGDVIARNFVLTPPMPFNGGTIDLDVGLVAIEGQNYLQDFVAVLGGFSRLLAVPQLSTALSVAGPLAAGLQRLLTGGSGRRHLGMRQSFAGQEVGSGYIAVVRATEDRVDVGRLCVVQDQLRLGDGPEPGRSVPFHDFDHMLLRVDVFEERDDWDSLETIATPLQEAVRALGDFNHEKADFYLQQAKVATVQAAELTRADRRRVIERLDTRYEEAKQDLGASGLTGDDGPTLARLMRGGMSTERALQLGEPNLDDVFQR
jgi:hypothetical protein